MKQMKEVKRRYIYDETYNKVMKWAKEKNLLLMHTPNNKSNFPFYLEQYLAELEYKIRRKEQ